MAEDSMKPPAVPVDGDLSKMASKLSAMYDAAGVTQPDEAARIAPIINLKHPPDDLAREVAGLLAAKDGRWGLFRWQGKEIVTVDELTGSRELMKAKAFRTWLPGKRGIFPVERWVKTEETDEQGKNVMKAVKGGLTKDQAETLLESYLLRERLPELRGINPIRMPVMDWEALDERGLPRMRLLRPGFDEGSGIYTCKGGVEFREDMPFDDAVSYLWNLFRWFGWRDGQRDFAVHLAAMVTMFCRGIYQGKAPMFFYNANIQQSGKSTLASYVTWIVHGTMRTRPLLPDAEDKLQELLNTSALRGNPYVFFDNVDWNGQVVKTVLLDEWLTNAEKEFRKLGGNDEGQVVLRGVTLGTGNKVELSPDLKRRTRIVDLLNRTAGADRELPESVEIIDSKFFANVENRRKGLAALWAIVRQWDEDGRPKWPFQQLGSFEQWSLVVPAIVLHAGRKGAEQEWNCLVEGSNEDIGDKEGAEFKKLAIFLLDEFGLDKSGADEAGVMRAEFEVTVAQIAGVARRNQVATKKLWPEKDVDSVMQTEGMKGGWKHVAPATNEPLDSLDDFGEEPKHSPEINAARERSASEWLSPKTRSSFGKELEARLHELDFKHRDGCVYRFTRLAGARIAGYQVERVS